MATESMLRVRGNVFSTIQFQKQYRNIIEGHPSDNLITGNRIELNRQYGIYVKLIPYGSMKSHIMEPSRFIIIYLIIISVSLTIQATIQTTIML